MHFSLENVSFVLTTDSSLSTLSTDSTGENVGFEVLQAVVPSYGIYPCVVTVSQWMSWRNMAPPSSLLAWLIL
jgi:hypothetical protein